MKIAIIGALLSEINGLKALLKNPVTTEKAGMTFTSGILSNNIVIIGRSGVGKVNAACCAQIMIDLFSPDAIINTGTAGSLDNRINICDIVLCTKAVQHDFDATGFACKKVGEIPFMKVSEFPADKDLLKTAERVCRSVVDSVSVFCGPVATGDQFISSDEKKRLITNNFDALCCEMEGAAIAQTAYLNNVPFLIIRSISDKADHSAEMDYPSFEKVAVENSLLLLKALIKELGRK